MAKRDPGLFDEERALILNAGNRTYTSPFEVADDDANMESVARDEGDDVGGGNIAYGNSPRNSGARLTGTPYSEPGR